jgi:heat shock protein HslJ
MNNSSTRTRTAGLVVGIIIVAVLVLAFCTRNGDTPSAAGTPLATNTSKPSPTSLPTNTPKPSPTSLPANTPLPTNTPKPSPTSPPANTPLPTNTPNPVVNIIWQWASLTEGSTGASTSVPNPADYTISFYPDGTLSGKADCNTFSGTYSQQNGFVIKLGASTGAACGEASLGQQYLDLLGSVAAGGPNGTGGLALETAGGAQRMFFNNGGSTVKP